jgi:hypothetical protein
VRCLDRLTLVTIAIRRRATSQTPTEAVPTSEPNPVGPALDPTVERARYFLRLANLPNFALDRLSRYEAILWRQVGQILYALDALDRRKPHERTRLISFGNGSASARPGLATIDNGCDISGSAFVSKREKSSKIGTADEIAAHLGCICRF